MDAPTALDTPTTIHNKLYFDKAVQTDASSPYPPSAQSFLAAAPTTPTTTVNGSHSISPSARRAYTHSPSLAEQPRASGPTRSPHLSRKHAQLPYSRPSAHHLPPVQPRISSLPEASPSYAPVIRESRRGVSLSERPRSRASLSLSDETSVETSFRSDTKSGSSRARRSLPSSDLPHTPTPPSSPESVMIIDGNISTTMRVPMAFLRQAPKPDFDEEAGWISWSSSPPKPIPALHGPSSLPYARCPSGAEGTIVEGEDLSRMIWGLGIEEDNQPSAKNTPNLSQKSPTVPSDISTRIQTQRPQRDDAVADGVRNQNVAAKQRVAKSRHALSQQSDSWTDTFGPGDDVLDDHIRSYNGQRGLGLDWQETLKHHHHTGSSEPAKAATPSLKPSAAVFVPASQQPSPRIFVEPRMPYTIAASPRLSAFEIAQQYRAHQRAQDILPTPPSSSSPQWTPQQHYQDPFPPLNLCDLVPPPKAQTNVDLSQELRKFVFERMQNPDIGLQAFPPAIRPGPPPNAPLPPLPPTIGRGHYGMEPMSPISPELPVPVRQTNKGPRSVPFARLLQRRLSAVPEEDHGAYEMHSPPPSPPKVAAVPLRAPRAPSSSGAEGFQSRAHGRVRSASGSRPGLGLPSPAMSAFGSPALPTPISLEDRWRSAPVLSQVQQQQNHPQTYASRVKASSKVPLQSANASDGAALTSTSKLEENGVENLWEKENKPKKKVRGGKKARPGDDKDTTTSPWVAASMMPEAWL